MLGMKELKEAIEITEGTVECPVKGCETKVKKMGNGNLKKLYSYLQKGKTCEATRDLRDYFCEKHRVYVTPSTFIYENYSDNLLWYDGEDKDLFDNTGEES